MVDPILTNKQISNKRILPSEVHKGSRDFGEEDHEYVHVCFATQQSKTNCIHRNSMMQELKHQY